MALLTYDGVKQLVLSLSTTAIRHWTMTSEPLPHIPGTMIALCKTGWVVTNIEGLKHWGIASFSSEGEKIRIVDSENSAVHYCMSSKSTEKHQF